MVPAQPSLFDLVRVSAKPLPSLSRAVGPRAGNSGANSGANFVARSTLHESGGGREWWWGRNVAEQGHSFSVRRTF